MHVVVVGSGVFGVWTAKQLLAGGADVTLIDAYGPGNSRSSSGDESRIVRCGYGPDAIYTRMAARSREAWRALSDRQPADGPLWHESGVLWLAGEDDYTRRTHETLTGEGLKCDVLTSTEMQLRFSQIAATGIPVALFEPDGGVVIARRAVQAVAREVAAAGATLLRGRAIAPSPASRVSAIQLADGRRVSGDRFVFACGAWLPMVFPELLAGRIRPTRQVVVYFGVPAGDGRFGADRLPAWVDFAAGVYGVPDLEHRGVKVGIDRHGPAIDPDLDDRIADATSIAVVRAWLARRLPALAEAPVVESRVCQYENTSTGDFLIDRAPAWDNVWLVGGGSGHGFKHGPAVGEEAARLVLTGDDPRHTFALAGKDALANRTVY